jgi:hypothetical protein
MNGIITGKEIMDRWGITAFQLQDVLREGDLVAVQDDLIDRRTPESDPCLFCDGEREFIKDLFGRVVSCQYGEPRDWHQCVMALKIVDPFEHMKTYHDFKEAMYHDPEGAPLCPSMVKTPRCINRWHEGYRAIRIEAAKFLLFELEAYENASGMWQPETEKYLNAVQHIEEETPDSPEEYVRQLKSKRLDDAEIKDRLYSVGKKKWNLSWWKVHCIVEGLTYPPKGNKGAAHRDDYKHACLRQIKAWRNRS